MDQLDISNKFVVSFDMCSLFTSIPSEESIDIICRKSALLSSPKYELRKLLLHRTKWVHFHCKNQLRKQTNGVPMRSLLWLILVDILMANLDQTKLKHRIHNTTYYSRYFYDTSIICDDMGHASQLLSHFNTSHLYITFTLQCERDNWFKFLYLSVEQKDDGVLGKIMYRKET